MTRQEDARGMFPLTLVRLSQRLKNPKVRPGEGPYNILSQPRKADFTKVKFHSQGQDASREKKSSFIWMGGSQLLFHLIKDLFVIGSQKKSKWQNNWTTNNSILTLFKYPGSGQFCS